MFVCIPTNGNAGLEDTVCDHFGSAAYFTIYNSESGELTILENGSADHTHGSCQPRTKLGDHEINAVICGGMGRRAIEALNAEGIRIFHADSSDVKQVVEQIKSGNLREMEPHTACAGHGNVHEHRASELPNAPHGHGGGSCCGRGGGAGHGEESK